MLARMMQTKPSGDVWVVLVNEFGAAGLDGALLEGSTAEARSVGSGSIHVHQLAGGCLCCTLSNVTALTIAQLVRRFKPDRCDMQATCDPGRRALQTLIVAQRRLFIEPSGLAHPAVLLDMLSGPDLGSSLTLGPVICMVRSVARSHRRPSLLGSPCPLLQVDASQFAGTGPASETPTFLSSPLLADQVSVADVLVGSKADLCDEGTLGAFHAWARGIYPPKALVTMAGHGHGSPDVADFLLDWPAGQGGPSTSQHCGPAAELQRQQEQHGGLDPALNCGTSSQHVTATGFPYWRHEVQRDGSHAACGWVFDRACQFDRQRLLAFLRHLAPRCSRLKGVFRVGPSRWEAASCAASSGPGGLGVQQVELQEIAYWRDSRMEVIVSASSADTDEARGAGAVATDWLSVEALLLCTLQP